MTEKPNAPAAPARAPLVARSPPKAAGLASPPRKFAELCNVSPMTIYRAIKQGKLKTIRIGPKTQLVPHNQIETLKSA